MTDGLRISEVASRETFDSDEDASAGSHVAQPVEPAREQLGFPNFDHGSTVSIWLHCVNRNQPLSASASASGPPSGPLSLAVLPGKRQRFILMIHSE